MPAVSNKKTEDVLRKILKKEKFEIEGKRKKPGETGVDIIASKAKKKYFIEVIGYKRSGPQRTRDFCQGFFQTVSRLNDGARHIVFAMPIEFKRGMFQRVNQYRISWKRIGKAFPELEVWFVDTESVQCETHKWKNLLEL
ncbi:MAG: hypothetical protein KJI72_03855 [Patescibacteria group bacterium]|nr:hypothetical protein [Patescibacteria group bacterium]